MRRRIKIKILSLLPILLLIGSECRGDESKNIIKIGVMLCQSGDCGDWGSAAAQGAMLATEEMNLSSKPGAPKFELIIEDTAETVSGARAISAFRSLLSRNIHFFIGPSWAPGALAIAPIASKRSDIVVLTPSASAREFSKSGKNIFNLRLPEEVVTRRLARYAIEQGKHRAAILSSQQPAESTQGKIFEDEFRKLGGVVTTRIETDPNSTNIRGEVFKIAESHPDVIFLMNYIQLESGLKELSTLRYTGMKMAISLDDARLGALGSLMEGAIVGRAADPTPEFKRRFFERFSHQPGLSAEGGYDAVKVLAQSIVENGGGDIKGIVSRIQKGKFSGAIGDFAFDDNREVSQEPSLFEVRGGRLSLIGSR